MKIVLLLISALAAFGQGMGPGPGVKAYSGGGGGITLVTHQANGSTNSNSATTTAQNTSTSTLIVLVATSFSGGVVVTDSSSNTWASLTQQTQGSFFEQIFYCYSPTTSASHTFTATGTSTFPAIAMLAFTGTAGTTVDQQNGTFSTSGTSVQPGSLTPGFANEVVVTGLTTGNGPGAFSINGSFVIGDTLQNATNSIVIGSAYWIQTTATASNPTWSWVNLTVHNLTSQGSFR